MPDIRTLLWTSTYDLLGGFRWRWLLTGSILAPAPATWTGVLQLQRADIGTVLQWQLRPADKRSDFSPIGGPVNTTWNATVFPIGPGSIGLIEPDPNPYP
jgi:hypothetical protein